MPHLKVRARLAGAWLALLAGSAAGADDALARLAWLGGCWQAQGGDAGSLEVWMPAAGGAMFGIGRTVRQGRTIEFEFMQVRAAADGTLAYIAQPSGRSPTTFPLLRQSDTEVVFENLQHDFPQRVAYRLDSAASLTARIEGARNGAMRAIEFPMRRQSCDAALGGAAR
jgi:hypothetical protein